MNFSRIFIQRPIATSLLMLAMLVAGMLAWRMLPVAALPQVDYPVLQVFSYQPGAGPDTVARTITAPLERNLGQISGLKQMSSSSGAGVSVITLQFSLDSDMGVVEQDVQSAIDNAKSLLPGSMPSPPLYRKVNPADTPILTLAVSSETLPLPRVHDLVDTRMAQKLAQVQGVGLVSLAGGQRPAIRVRADATALSQAGLTLADLQSVIAAANANLPKGSFDGPVRSTILDANDQLDTVEQYESLIVSWQNGAPLRLGDVASIVEGPEDRFLAAWADAERAILINVQRQPDANVIEVADRIRQLLPQLTATLPASVDVRILTDRTQSIRASVRDVQKELLLAVGLVVLVTLLFLRSVRTTLIPAVAVPISLVGTFAVMYLLGYSLNNLSLMALTIATGFVVDDAIVMMENIARHREMGKSAMQAALDGAREIGFTLISLTVSLIAVLIPLLFMGDVAGRLFHEFAVTLAVAIGISLIVSLTLTPMMSARMMGEVAVGHGTGAGERKTPAVQRGQGYSEYDEVTNQRGADSGADTFARSTTETALCIPVQPSDRGEHDPCRPSAQAAVRDASADHDAPRTGFLDRVIALYDRSLTHVLNHQALMMLVMLATVAATVLLYFAVPKGFFPVQDSGVIQVVTQAPGQISYQAMLKRQEEVARLVLEDPDVESLSSFIGVDGNNPALNTGRMLLNLKSHDERSDDVQTVIGRLRRKMAERPPEQQDIGVWFQPVQELSIEDRISRAQYQFTLSTPNRELLASWVPKLQQALAQRPELTDLGSDLQNDGRQAYIEIDRAAASRLGIRVQSITEALQNAFAQRQISTMFTQSNQYRVVLEQNPALAQGMAALDQVFVAGGDGAPVALSAVTRWHQRKAPIVVNHQSQFPAANMSFNLAKGHSLGDAVAAVEAVQRQLEWPAAIETRFQGAAEAYRASLANTLWLILAAVVTMYLVLGILYESAIHPITILSTLPSATVGALAALLLSGAALDMVAVIGIVLLIGLVKKNGIMMVDFALEAERHQRLPEREAIHQAALLRFRPILMTTMAALLGAVPLMLAQGSGAELRQPLGLVMVGGLLVSQVLTLYTTPVVYLFFARLGRWWRKTA
ncbi:MAG: efflux RND transporter permease subunit [Lautropia sp.]|nr:efflux RND transporter permease subunit [Lautropia sp.]